MKRISASSLLLWITLPLLSSLHARGQQEVLVAAAADLRFAMDSLITVFAKDNPGTTVRASYGSSGNFFEQISAGAPFDLFFSADIEYPKQLQQQNKTISPAVQYGRGQLVLWSKKLDPGALKMQALLDPAIHKIAIANPVHAPYGARAEETLHTYKLYEQVKDKLVMGENISQAAQYVTSGAADIGIIALSLARSPTMQQQGGKYWLIPENTHQPLLQGYTMLVHARNNQGAKKFSDFIRSAAAQAVLKYFGLDP